MSNETETVSERRDLSPRGKPFIVQNPEFQCMAYRDRHGKWRDYFHGDEIRGDVKVVSEG